MNSFCCGDHAGSYTAQKLMVEIAFCQPTSISEYDFTTSRNVSNFGKSEANITGVSHDVFP